MFTLKLMKTGFYAPNSIVKRISAGLLAVWMSGIVFLLCCGMADCCKDGKCSMGGACCQSKDACPMKKNAEAQTTQTAEASKVTVVTDGDSCCQPGADCCKGGGAACCRKKS